jgi:MscS family membrane protein
MDPIILFLIVTAGIYLLYRLMMIVINRALKKRKFPADAGNVLKLLIRVITIFVVIIALMTVFPIPDEYLVSFSSIGGIIIGFAATEIMSQIISGLYIISTQPFGVNDFIILGDTEGIVLEIGVNYTIIQRIDGTLVRIPNKKILDSTLKNCTVEMTEEFIKLNLTKKTIENIENIRKKSKKTTVSSLVKKFKNMSMKKVFEDFSDLIFEKEITRYTFDIDVYFSIPPEIVLKKLDILCEKYKAVYKSKPTYSIMKFGWRATIKFIITCADALVIVDHQDQLMNDLANTLYGEQEGS